MDSKTITLLGVVVSGLFLYSCIDAKKDQIAQELGLMDTQSTDIKVAIIEDTGIDIKTMPEKPVEVKTAITERSDPAFGIMFDGEIKVVGMFVSEAKKGALVNFINELCAQSECINDIRFSDDIKVISWEKDIIRLIQLMQEKNIQNASLFINSNI